MVVVPFVNWQVGSVPAEIAIAVGVPTVGVIVTDRITRDDGPLQPFADTRISTDPEKLFAQVMTPVVGLIEPAAALLNDQLKPVLFVAVVAYVVVVVPFVNWQVGSVPAAIVIAVGVPTVGVNVRVAAVEVAEGNAHPLTIQRYL